ncbi:hypothetical protein PYW08_007247 [Mythimna loreyi]|uniref:Uncharacterized protein n=1 Tax=Mythimna loreyi TaxID=667449 RepID=A0ACC2RBB2_9NEOP|nr:hypothetical protein PYW08_007247 [Mythimna loreyi]
MGKIIKLNNNRRLRTPNWSLEEKQYLLELIKERKEVVVTKTNNGPNHSEEKDIAWNEILRALSAKFGSNIEIKTEYIDEDQPVSQPSCSGIDNTSASIDVDMPQDKNHTTTQIESSASSVSEQNSEPNDFDVPEENISMIDRNMRTVAVMTDAPYNNVDDVYKMTAPFHRELQEYFKYSATERMMKMETLKEERQVVRAMRETAELNKIIAEQKLKHVLWAKKQDMA